jgi:hypothetical protein
VNELILVVEGGALIAVSLAIHRLSTWLDSPEYERQLDD